ncbi:unnamed protein product [Blepharisma stoltei]|uniref:Superoxide dismutase n=1 Tax=Blepharisma stoltei TaxID=1481888 RepID=A0AAU9IHV9_9CILI|nr:unnamed protein product [Blepharisma stoltei]
MSLKRLSFLISISVSLATICSKSDFSPLNEVANFTLAALPYGYDALDPTIWPGHLYYHYAREHAYRLNSLNTICTNNTNYQKLKVTDLLIQYGTKDEALGRFAGGHYGHSLFWWILIESSCSGNGPTGKLFNDIESTWGSYNEFVEEFTEKANTVFGSGWVWLSVKSNNGNLAIETTEDDNSPLAGGESYPFLGIDMWEHAYYISYLYDPFDWIEHWWTIIDWELVEYWYEQYASQKTPVPV